jgi:ubiquinone biosynthesis protein COQ4
MQTKPGFLSQAKLRWEQRVRPLKARAALKRLMANPDDTGEVFVVIRSLSGRSFERLLRRVRRDPMGARVLRERRDLIPVLSDSETLLALPEETLGHRYASFVAREQISATGLAEASTFGRDDEFADFDPEAAAFGSRLRDMHDLWHVVTGYDRDVLGELALLAFTYEQTRNPGIGYIVNTVERRIRKGGNEQVSDFLRDATARGKNAKFLPAADWEALLMQPLDDVRRELRVDPVAAYEQNRTEAGEAARAAAGA